ncbi:hypothetical protein [Actinoplanes regularis]|uniref:hypothetical protein n=1 Tax=Actinoplanes regularis TaxID=52697 RepID=UPI0011782951|nr:hypothetical protein [Actinoplanes regularis]
MRRSAFAAARTGTKFKRVLLFGVGLALLCAAVIRFEPPSRAAAQPTFGALPVIWSLPVDPYRDPMVRKVCPDPALTPVLDGRPIRVDLKPAQPLVVGEIPAEWWRKPPVTDPGWWLNFQALTWMSAPAVRAARDHQLGSLTAMIRQMVTFHVVNPDPGDIRFGWDEGTALRRLATENCLYALTREPALVDGMEADVAVLTGKRYAGPPKMAVHNHGMMANLRMIDAAKILGRPEWAGVAVNRILSEAPLAFSAQGVSFEQSSLYQQVNAGLWENAAKALEGFPGYGAQAAKIRALVRKAERVQAFMTAPDGDIVQVGDADRVAGRKRAVRGDLVLRDNETGWMIGRTSWTDPNAIHYTVRYGPGRRAHGQEDRAGGLTWSALGTRILVGTGRYNYDTKEPLSTYRRAPRSQNVAAPADGRIHRSGTSTITAVTKPDTHRVKVFDEVYGDPHRREITIAQHQARLVVRDAFEGVRAWSQSWHLDPAWMLVSGAVGDDELTFRHPSGQRLTIATTGRVAGIWSGDARGPHGWVFPKEREKKPAYELSFAAPGGAPVETIFKIS